MPQVASEDFFVRVVLSILALILSLGPARGFCQGLAPGFSATVARVVDASTFALDDGSQLRLAGVLLPHPGDTGAHAAASPDALAARAEVEALVLGKSITIAFGSERRDRYGRHLAHVAIEDGPERRWLQAHLLAQGLARVVTRAHDKTCEAEMLAAERAARQAGLGLWKTAAYRIRAATDLDVLTALAGTFQVVEGSVTDSRGRSGSLRLEFAEKGRFGFVAVLPAAKGAVAREAWKGRRVRLRGWLEERGGRPSLDLTAIGTIETLE